MHSLILGTVLQSLSLLLLRVNHRERIQGSCRRSSKDKKSPFDKIEEVTEL